MKLIKNISIVVTVFLITVSCTDYNINDTGLSKTAEDKTMWEYFGQDSYNWDSLKVMVKHANLKKMFDGTSTYGSNVTFFGITNHSIRRYILSKGYEQVTDIPVADCEKLILSSFLDKKIMLEEFPRGRPSQDVYQSVMGEGGKIYTTLSGKKLWIYTFKSSYNEVPEAGPLKIHIVSTPNDQLAEHTLVSVASSNILTKTGVVHSLEYNFTIFK